MTFENIVFWFGIVFIFLLLFSFVLAIIITINEYIIQPYFKSIEEEKYQRYQKFLKRYESENKK